MNIRQAQEADAKQLIDLFDTLASETKFMLPEPNERQVSIDEQKNIIKSFANSESRVMLVAEDTQNKELLGFVMGNAFNRNKHSMYCVIGVKQSATGQGLGFKLLEHLQGWAIEQGITRMELTVLCHNVRAKKLYEKFGFEIEGIKRQSMKIDGEYFDEYMMSKLLNVS